MQGLLHTNCTFLKGFYGALGFLAGAASKAEASFLTSMFGRVSAGVFKLLVKVHKIPTASNQLAT